MSPSAVPRLPRKVTVDVAKCSATPATQSEGRCRQVPRLCVSKLCVDKLCGDKLCGDKLCVDKLWAAGERREAGGQGGSAQPKTRTPHKDVGKYDFVSWDDGIPNIWKS